MYRPEQFREDRPDVLCAAMREIGFAALVTPAADGIEVTHLPVVVGEDAAGPCLEAHVARANGHWRAIAAGAPSVAIFQGPHAYVTPAWYPSKREQGKVVPTWSYIVVHAHGTLEPVHDADWLARHLEDLTHIHEAPRPEPWQVSDAPASFIESMTRGIVGLRMPVARLEGAWKVNQHKNEPDRTGTAEGLAGSGAAGARLAEVLKPPGS